MTHKRGDTRSDGFRFWAYTKSTSRIGGLHLREKWYSPPVYDKAVKYVLEYRKTWGKKQNERARCV